MSIYSAKIYGTPFYQTYYPLVDTVENTQSTEQNNLNEIKEKYEFLLTQCEELKQMIIDTDAVNDAVDEEMKAAIQANKDTIDNLNIDSEKLAKIDANAEAIKEIRNDISNNVLRGEDTVL